MHKDPKDPYLHSLIFTKNDGLIFIKGLTDYIINNITLFENESITDINYPDFLAPDVG